MAREGMQTRTAQTEFRAVMNGDNPIIEGKFITFTGVYELWPGAYERINPELEIEGDDIRALVNHDTTLVLGRTLPETLKLTRKDDGIHGEIDVNPNDTDAMNCYARVERGDVTQCSFGFDILDETAEYHEDGTVEWVINKIRLYEVSVCTFPAYEDTGVSARKKELEDMKARSLEAWKESTKKKLKGGAEC